ncbi:MAG: DUF1566 domain-containing protein [Flavobacterium sp.]|nr:DUF1566 domain-containing protein [Flavobacterium sp.]
MKLNKLVLSLLALSFLTLSCSKDDDNSTPINLQDLEVTIDENPTNGEVIGTVQSNSTTALTFTIVSQTPAGALEIDAATGDLTVLDNGLFDFESNPTITATVSASGASNNATVTIELVDKPEIGEYKYGGVIFWVNAAGNEGLVCAVTDQSTGVQWYNGMSMLTNANGSSINTGQANTNAIVNAQGAGIYAAKICDDLILNGFNDWFLPSHDELEEMHGNKSIIDNVSLANSGTIIQAMTYWCSTEDSLHAAETYSFTTTSTPADFKSALHRVRAVRHWTDF